MMRRQHINNKKVSLVILDEADEMLSSGLKSKFIIFSYLDSGVQLCLFSATMPSELSKITEKFMRDPIKILVKSECLFWKVLLNITLVRY